MKEQEKNTEEMTFEEALKRAQELTEKMESGSLTLEESLRFYEEGNRLLQRCEEQLQAAKCRMEQWSEETMTDGE